MSKVFACWSRLSSVQREICIVRTKPRRLSYKWRDQLGYQVTGELLIAWSHDLMEIEKRTSTVDFERMISPRGISLPINWTLYLVGNIEDVDSMKQTLVAEACGKELAVAACNALKGMKQYGLQSLLKHYEIHYRDVSLRFCSDNIIDNSSSREPNNHFVRTSLCGVQVIAVSNADHTSDEANAQTATIGGAILFNGRKWALTIGHIFASPMEVSNLDNITSANVHVQSHDRHLVGDGNCLIPFQSTSSATHINCTTSRVHVYRSEDWALIPIENQNFSTLNQFRGPDGGLVTVNGITDEVPIGLITAATGASEPTETEICMVSLLLLPGSDRPRIAWSANMASKPGDSGSWLVDQRGKACAVIVAASEEEHEVFCLPLVAIFNSICQNFGSIEAPSMTLDDSDPEVQADLLSSIGRERDQSLLTRPETLEESPELMISSILHNPKSLRGSPVQDSDGNHRDSESRQMSPSRCSVTSKNRDPASTQTVKKATASEIVPPQESQCPRTPTGKTEEGAVTQEERAGNIFNVNRTMHKLHRSDDHNKIEEKSPGYALDADKGSHRTTAEVELDKELEVNEENWQSILKKGRKRLKKRKNELEKRDSDLRRRETDFQKRILELEHEEKEVERRRRKLETTTKLARMAKEMDELSLSIDKEEAKKDYEKLRRLKSQQAIQEANGKAAIEAACRARDLEFAAYVQNLFWDEGLPVEMCDRILQLHDEQVNHIAIPSNEEESKSGVSVKYTKRAEAGPRPVPKSPDIAQHITRAEYPTYYTQKEAGQRSRYYGPSLLDESSDSDPISKVQQKANLPRETVITKNKHLLTDGKGRTDSDGLDIEALIGTKSARSQRRTRDVQLPSNSENKAASYESHDGSYDPIVEFNRLIQLKRPIR